MFKQHEAGSGVNDDLLSPPSQPKILPIAISEDRKRDKSPEIPKSRSPKRKKKHDNGIVLKIDNGMHQMEWLKKFKRSLSDEKLDYADNEYDSSGFNPINIKIQDSIKSRKIAEAEKSDLTLKQESKSLLHDVSHPTPYFTII